MKTLKHLFNHLQRELLDGLLGAEKPTASKSIFEAGLRSIVLHNQVIQYRIERTHRKTVGMLIDAQGLRVRAAPRVSVMEIERILYSKADWIVKTLYKAHIQAQSPTKISFVPNLQLNEGDTITVLGQTMYLRWGNAIYAPEHSASEREIWAKRPRDMNNSEHIAQAVEAALDAYLLKYLQARAQQYAQLHGLNYREIALSNAHTTWGTCRRDGLIRINWRLVFLEPKLVDYVLAHELAHTVQMNHSPKFWQQVAVLCPDYQRLRKQLRQYDLRNA